MNIDVDALYPPIKVNLLEHGAMGGIFETESLIEISGERAYEDLLNMTGSRCRSLVRDLARKVLPPARAAEMTDDHLDRICQLLRDREIEAIWQPIFDAHTFAWQDAYVPSDRDIELAMRHAQEHFAQLFARREFWDFVVQQDDEAPVSVKVWRPGRTWTRKEFRESAVAQIRYERDPNGAGRFLIFDFAKMAPLKGLLDHLVTLEGEDASWVLEDMKEQFKDWAENYVTLVSEFILNHSWDMAAGRVDFSGQWKSMLDQLDDVESIKEEFTRVIGD